VDTVEPVSAELAALLRRCTSRRLWAEQDEGPYHRDAQPRRRDVVEDREGAPLQLGLRLLLDAQPLRDAEVEIWQCDALGRYSGFAPPDSSVVVTAATAPRAEYVAGETFLRGRQTTDAEGMVEFRTIYPGWYPGRTVHIHLIVRTAGSVLTSQLYFPDDRNDAVLATAPYRDRPRRDTTNDTDTIFPTGLPTGGEPAILDVVPLDGGYRAAIRLEVPVAAVPGAPR
jgi:protocatechuate 3,4-dioxygenase beta subunit